MTTRRTHYYMTIRSATKPNSFNVLFERPDPAADQRPAQRIDAGHAGAVFCSTIPS